MSEKSIGAGLSGALGSAGDVARVLDEPPCDRAEATIDAMNIKGSEGGNKGHPSGTAGCCTEFNSIITGGGTQCCSWNISELGLPTSLRHYIAALTWDIST